MTNIKSIIEAASDGLRTLERELEYELEEENLARLEQAHTALNLMPLLLDLKNAVHHEAFADDGFGCTETILIAHAAVEAKIKEIGDAG